MRTEFFIKTFIGKPESAFSFVNDNALARFYIYDIFTTSISLIESLQCLLNMLNLSVKTVHLIYFELNNKQHFTLLLTRRSTQH